MKRLKVVMAVSVVCALAGVCFADQAGAPAASALPQAYDLGGERSADTQYFHLVTNLVQYALDGTRAGSETYRLDLKCVPGRQTGTEGDTFTCRRFTIRRGDGPEVSIPALEGWTYVFTQTASGTDEEGQVLGIPHAKFEGLADANGAALPPLTAYMVYNTFIDFHAFCYGFAAPTLSGKGIQDLKAIGQRIVHAAAFSEPPVNVGTSVAEGSYFRNGEVTLELKGLSVVDGAACALVGFDSGEGSFKMLMEPMPDFKITTVGASHYFGDLYVDLASKWPRKIAMGELVISETQLPALPNMPANKVNAVHERASTIRAVSEEEFEQLVAGE